MNFFKQAQDFAAAANAGSNTNTDNQGANAPASGGFGSLMSEAQTLMQSQGTPAQSGGPQSTLPGGRQPPTTGQLLQSTQLLYGAATGQKVDNQQLAGAAEDLLGGLASHGNLDQGQYGAYINQAESYLQKYSGQGQAPATSAPAPHSTSTPASAAPAASAPVSNVRSAGASDPSADPSAGQNNYQSSDPSSGQNNYQSSDPSADPSSGQNNYQSSDPNADPNASSVY